MRDAILEKIERVRSWFSGNRGAPQDIYEIDGWMEQAKKLFLLQSLKEHDGIKYVLEIFQNEINDINDALLNKYSKDLRDSERDRLLDKRSLAKKYLDLFVPMDEEFEKLEKDVDNELDKM